MMRKLALINDNYHGQEEPKVQAHIVGSDKIYKVRSNAEIISLIDEDIEEIDHKRKNLVLEFVLISQVYQMISILL